MCYSSSLEQKVAYMGHHSHVDYSSTNLQIYEFSAAVSRTGSYSHSDENYSPNLSSPRKIQIQLYSAAFASNEQNYAGESETYSQNTHIQHFFTPLTFLNASRPKTKFVDDDEEIKAITNEIFELMKEEKLPVDISINVLPFDEFKSLHSRFGPWNNGILGFSLNGDEKKIFIRENNLDELMLVIGHEIGHVITRTLPNKHDEEAKAFAFSLEWAKTIKLHNVAGLGLNISDEPNFKPARNGLHDIAFGFVDLMVKKGRKAIRLHDDLSKRYISIFNKHYF